jgi:ferric-dicitrate binding protein FerR (iron transport regulator)
MTALPARRWQTRAIRLALVVLAALLLLVLLPRWLQPAPPPPALQGRLVAGRLVYAGAPVSEVLEDVRRLTGFAVVAFPDVGARRFSGELPADAGGKAAITALAGRMKLQLRQGGPHWALVAPPSAPSVTPAASGTAAP